MSADRRAPPGARRRPSPAQATGLLAFLTSTDHKRIGIAYMVTAFAFFLLGGALAEVIRAELYSPGSRWCRRARYNELFTMHGSIMLFLFLGPFAFGLANYLVPLQIGARDMAFPRLNALCYWFFLFGGLTMLAGFLTADGAADFGWTAYAPLSDLVRSPGRRRRPLDHGRRAHRPVRRAHRGEHRDHRAHHAGPGHDDVPHADLHLEHARDERPRADRVPGADQRRRDALRRPPPRGAHLRPRRRRRADPVAAPVLVLRPPRGVHPRAAVLRRGDRGARRCSPAARCSATGAWSWPRSPSRALSVGVWAHHMFATGAVLLPFFSGAVDAHRGADRREVLQLDRHDVGRPHPVPDADAVRPRVPVHVPGRRRDRRDAGVAADRLPRSRHATSSSPTCTTCCSAGSVFALFAGIYYWFPKVTGRHAVTRAAGKLQFWMTFVGFNLTFFVQHMLGLDGMPRRVADYLPSRRLHGAQPDVDASAPSSRRVDAAVPVERVAHVAPAADAGRRRPVGGPHARVGDDVAAAAHNFDGRCRRSGRTARSGTAHHPDDDGDALNDDRRPAARVRRHRRSAWR